MPLSIIEDIKSVSDLKKHTKEVFRQAHETGRPVIITVSGRPDVVILDAEVFEKKLRAFNLLRLLAASEKDIRQGRTRPARSFLKAFRHAKKIQG